MRKANTSTTITHHLKRLDDKNWVLIMPNPYDRAMTFCRVDEFYCSPSEQFYGKYFSFFDFMDWYCSISKGVFDYAEKKNEFTIPFFIIDMWCRLLLKNEKESQLSGHEKILVNVWDELSSLLGREKHFNLICRGQE